MQDFAHQMQWLVDVAYPDAPVLRVVLDNLNTHRTASLYETFPPAEARRIGSSGWIFTTRPSTPVGATVAEIEFSVLSRACLKGETPTPTHCNWVPNHGLRDRAQRRGRHHQLAVPEHSRCPIQIASPLSLPFQT